jgi:hypothetical protein
LDPAFKATGVTSRTAFGDIGYPLEIARSQSLRPEEHRLAAIAALRDVMRGAGNDDAGDAGDWGNVTPASQKGK